MSRLGFVFCLLLLLSPASVRARSSSLYAYPESSIWTSVIRLVRVDLDSPIVEKDRDAGYVLFSYTHAGKQHSGSVEVVPTADKGEPRVKVLIQVAGMPSYVERMMLDKLEKKLAREFGAPLDKAGPAKADRAQPGDEGGADSAKSDSSKARDSEADDASKSAER